MQSKRQNNTSIGLFSEEEQAVHLGANGEPVKKYAFLSMGAQPLFPIGSFFLIAGTLSRRAYCDANGWPQDSIRL
jgi:hypothetical protein